MRCDEEDNVERVEPEEEECEDEEREVVPLENQCDGGGDDDISNWGSLLRIPSRTAERVRPDDGLNPARMPLHR
jgi:hypothetical protein